MARKWHIKGNANGTLMTLRGCFFYAIIYVEVMTMFVKVNPNPYGEYVGDCVIRALSTALDETWDRLYAELAVQGYMMKDMPSSNHVWSTYLGGKGFKCAVVPNNYTVMTFSENYPSGVYILATGSHVVTVIDGNYYDSWDSGKETPIYYFYKEEKNGV